MGMYAGCTITLVGGVHRANYEKTLKLLGFDRIYHVKDRKDLKKMPSLVKKSDLAVVITSCCSHEHSGLTKKVCQDEGIPFAFVPGGSGPENIAWYLAHNYSNVMQ